MLKEVEVEPTSAPRSDSKWATLIPAIVVPIVVVLFLIAAFLWARFVAKRKRDQKKVKPLKVVLPKNLFFLSLAQTRLGKSTGRTGKQKN